jgi:tRNA (adenine57-N1/adenine58-N1)-methyltransferase
MIDEGTRVLLVDEGGKKYTVKLEKRMLDVRGLGVVDGDALCGASFGQELRIGSKVLTVLRPSVKDILSIMERRAQIIIPKDSFSIPLHLDLGCGCQVIEGGVGSGGLTVVLLKAVGPQGKVFSYDNRGDLADVARKNVEMSGLGVAWDLKIQDVCTADLAKDVDAAVLDIPNPWDALDNVIRSLRAGGHIGCYVPNANQLEKVVNRMRELGLDEITAFETLQREMVVHEGGVRPSFDMLGHTGYLAFGRRLRQ